MYRYPDSDDIHLFKNVFNDDWKDGELEEKYVRECVANISERKRGIILDAGCGTGSRLMHAYVSSFRKIIALDPDISRLRKAEVIFKKLQNSFVSLNNSADFVHSSIQDYQIADAYFDCIICAHIIQHICTKEVDNVLNKLYRCLKSGGYLMLLTTNWRKGEDRFSMTDTLTNKYYKLTQKEFDKSVLRNDSFLPVQLFSDRRLKTLINKHGFEIIFFRKYHGYPKIKGDNFIFVYKP